jgi:RNA polymerase sigma-70 factor (ECF subfamily)
MTDRSDDELLRLSGDGDQAAFASLVGRHLGRAGKLAARVTGNRADAEDAVQEAFLRVWLKAPDWRPEASGGAKFSTWFYRVLMNLCIDRTRRIQPGPLDAAGEIVDPHPDSFDILASNETTRRVAAAVAKLPDRQRAALALCHYEGMSNTEAAAVLDLSVGAVESLLVRARRNLRGALAEFVGDEKGER